MAAYLKPPPSDLTQLAKHNGGIFPFAEVVKTIDGRSEVKGHGSREMPVWGKVFKPPYPSQPLDLDDAGSLGLNEPEAVVRGRILALVEYLHRIQQK